MTLCKNCDSPIFGITAPELMTRGQYAMLDFHWMMEGYKNCGMSDEGDVILPM